MQILSYGDVPSELFFLGLFAMCRWALLRFDCCFPTLVFYWLLEVSFFFFLLFLVCSHDSQ
jgi:hypothetical protein